MALEGSGGARLMRLTDIVFPLPGGAPLGPDDFDLNLTPFLAADGAAAAAGASKNTFGILFLFEDGMVVKIVADTSPAVGGPPTGTSTTAAEGGGPPSVCGPCRRSMAARSDRVVAGKGGAEEIGRRLGFAETLRAQWKGG